MKTIALITGMLFAVLTVNAQWYFNQYGVTDMNELNKDQLELAMQQATKLKKAGVGVTIGSTVLAVVGTAIYIGGLNDITDASTYSGIDDGASRAYSGVGVMTIGYLGMAVGVPMWIAGGTRQNVIKIHLRKYEPTGQIIPSIGFTYRF